MENQRHRSVAIGPMSFLRGEGRATTNLFANLRKHDRESYVAAHHNDKLVLRHNCVAANPDDS